LNYTIFSKDLQIDKILCKIINGGNNKMSINRIDMSGTKMTDFGAIMGDGSAFKSLGIDSPSATQIANPSNNLSISNPSMGGS
jgi:hypothetical protein